MYQRLKDKIVEFYFDFFVEIIIYLTSIETSILRYPSNKVLPYSVRISSTSIQSHCSHSKMTEFFFGRVAIDFIFVFYVFIIGIRYNLKLKIGY